MAGTLKRLVTHLFTADARGLFPPAAMERIAAAIDIGETCHAGEVCFAVEAALPWRDVLSGADPRQRALDAFGRLRVWDTAANNGVLVYLLLAEHRIEIVADRALARVLEPAAWQDLVTQLATPCRDARFEDALGGAVERLDPLLRAEFPRHGGADRTGEDGLSDRPVLR